MLPQVTPALFNPQYAAKVLSVERANIIGYWPMWERMGPVARDYSLQGNDGVFNGGLRYQQEGIGDGRTSTLFGEPTTNLCANPSIETNTNGYATGGTNTIIQSTERAKEGSNSLKCTFQDNVSLAHYAITLTATAHSMGMQVWVPSDYDGANLVVSFRNFTGMTGEVLGAVDMALRDQWQLVLAYGTPVAGDLFGHLQIYTTGAAATPGRFVYIDAIRCEAKAYSTPYCDGSLGVGFAWTGAAHASTSTRAGAYNNVISAGLQADFNGVRGSTLNWVKATEAAQTDGQIRRLYNFTIDGNNFLILAKSSTNNTLQASYKAQGNPTENIATAGYNITTWLAVIVTWDSVADELSMYVNGNHILTRTTIGGAMIGQPAFAVIGASNPTPTNVWHDRMGPAVLWSTALSQRQATFLSSLR